MQSDSDIIYIRHQVVDKLIGSGLMCPAAQIIEEADELVRYILGGRQTDSALDQNAHAPTEA